MDIDFYCDSCGNYLESGSAYEYFSDIRMDINPCSECVANAKRTHLELLLEANKCIIKLIGGHSTDEFVLVTLKKLQDAIYKLDNEY